MKKYLKIALILSAILVILLFLSSFSIQFTGKTIDNLNRYSYTKAICNQTNYCQDYEIVCNGQKIRSITSLTGYAVQNPKNWKDPRDEETIKKLC